MSPTFKTVIKGLSNVFYDDSSTYNFDVLNESLFLEDTFIALSRLMDDAFDDYLFFILSSHDEHVMPSSISYSTNRKKVLIFILSLVNTVQIAYYFLLGYYFSGLNLLKLLNVSSFSKFEKAMYFRYKYKKKKGFFLGFSQSFKFLMDKLTLFKSDNEVQTVNIKKKE